MESTFNHVSVARQYKLAGMQKFVAERLAASLHETASVTAMAEIPMRGLLEAQAAWRARGVETSLTHHMLHLAARCLERHRPLNGTLHDGVVYEYGPVNLALAISMPNGDLQAVVIHDASHKTVADIAAETTALISLAREGRLGLDHVRGGTFTLSNYGSLEHTVWATPIIPPGQSGVLGMGRARPGLVADDSPQGWHVETVLPLSFTYDHRVINGVPAGRFLEDLADLMIHASTETPHEP